MQQARATVDRRCRNRTAAAVLAIGALCVGLLAPSAEAKSPPRGSYTCDPGGGTLKILAHKHYKYGRGTGSRGRFKTEGQRIKYKSGPFASIYAGKWFVDSGDPVISNRPKGHNPNLGTLYCRKYS